MSTNTCVTVNNLVLHKALVTGKYVILHKTPECADCDSRLESSSLLAASLAAILALTSFSRAWILTSFLLRYAEEQQHTHSGGMYNNMSTYIQVFRGTTTYSLRWDVQHVYLVLTFRYFEEQQHIHSGGMYNNMCTYIQVFRGTTTYSLRCDVQHVYLVLTFRYSEEQQHIHSGGMYNNMTCTYIQVFQGQHTSSGTLKNYNCCV